MKSPYASELQPNQPATALFLVQSKEVRQKKTGEPYLSLMLADRTGDIEAKMWDKVVPVLDTFERDDFIRVRGVVTVYGNRLQLTIQELMRVADSDVDYGDFFPASKRDPQEMFAELRAIVEGLASAPIRTLLNAFLDDEEIARMVRIAPAAKSIHHAYLGGLLEHVLSLCALAKVTAAHYGSVVDLDLLLAGVVLHDIGKIHELTYDRSFGYSTQGQLLGHIDIALRMMDEKFRLVPDFPPKLRLLLEHLVLSHHGALEFGSPKTPQFAEAMLLHQIDNMDSKMEAIRSAIEKDKNVDGDWTNYVPSLERPLLKKDKFLSERPAASPPKPPAAPSARPEHRPETGSLFGDKLKDALKS